MAINPQTPEYASNLPWFMVNLSDGQLITGPTIPGDISDTKSINLTETQIPGLNYAPIQPAGNGNRKIGFTIQIIRRNGNIGNSALLQQFHSLRNQATGLRGIFGRQFNPNPKVLFSWGTGSVPLVYFVAKVDIVNKQYFVNQVGNPEYSEVSVELILDEIGTLYKAEVLWRKIASLSASAGNLVGTEAQGNKGRVY